MKYLVHFFFIFLVSVSGVHAGYYEDGLELLKDGKKQEAKEIFYEYIATNKDYTKCEIYTQLSSIFQSTNNQDYDLYKEINNVCIDVKAGKKVVLEEGLLDISHYKESLSAYIFLHRLMLINNQFDLSQFNKFLTLKNVQIKGQEGNVSYSFYGEAYNILADYYKKEGNDKQYILNTIQADKEYNYSEKFGVVFYTLRKGRSIDTHQEVIEQNYGKEYFKNIQSFQYIRNVLNDIEDYDKKRTKADLAIVKSYYKKNKEEIDVFYNGDYSALYLESMDKHIEKQDKFEEEQKIKAEKEAATLASENDKKVINSEKIGIDPGKPNDTIKKENILMILVLFLGVVGVFFIFKNIRTK